MKKLNENADKTPFKIPENYFEEVNRKIIAATSGYETETRQSGIFRRIRPILLMAASVTGFILLSYAAIRLLSPDHATQQVAEYFPEDFPGMVVNDIDIFTIESSAASLVLFEEVPELSKSEIIDYLLLENIEINDIYEQL